MFVCLGNICRSPLAEHVFRGVVREAGLEDRFVIHSSGTGHWHVGEPADGRMRATAKRFGHSLENHRGRQLEAIDLAEYDHLFVMDKSNLHDVLFLDRNDTYGHKVRLFRELDPDPGDYQVPDPYYGGPGGFDDVYRIVERTSRNLLDQFAEAYKLKNEPDPPT